MTRHRLLVKTCLAVLLLVPPAAGQQPSLVVENGRVIVGNGIVLEQGSVVVASDRIVAVTDRRVDALGARKIDAAGKTVLPGLIDAHVHLLVGSVASQPQSESELQAFVRDRLPSTLQAYLEAGITTVMSTGDFWPAIREVRERIRLGGLVGPRLLTSGPVFTARDGHPAAGPLCGPWRDGHGNLVVEANPWCREHLAVVAESPEGVHEAMDRLAREGVDHIKIVFDDTNPPVAGLLEEDLVREIIHAAHAHDLRAYAHISEAKKALAAIEYGLDGLVHVPSTTSEPQEREALMETLRARGVTVATTLVVVDELRREMSRMGEHELAESFGGALRALQEVTRRIAEADADLVVLGTDAPQLPPAEALHREIQLLVQAGLAPDEIIRAATRNAAIHIGRGSDLGTLEPGKLADVIIVDGNPLTDLAALRSVELVLKAGTRVQLAARETR